MARLIYASNMSLDGWTEDAAGALDWAPPDDEVFVSITRLMGSVGTYLYGRRMYETMAVWETDPTLAAHSALRAEYATTWKAAGKVVYSSTLDAPVTAHTTIERSFDADGVRAMKASADRDLLIGGPHLAAQALDAELIDEMVLYVWPIVLSGRNPALANGARVDLTLAEEDRFVNGVVRLRYLVAREREQGTSARDLPEGRW